MVVSHRESTISSNIRAIIEQLNLNPVERRRLIEARGPEHQRCGIKQRQLQQVESMHQAQERTRVTIGVYGLGQQHPYHQEIQPRPRKPVRRIEPRPRQRLPPRLELEEVFWGLGDYRVWLMLYHVLRGITFYFRFLVMSTENFSFQWFDDVPTPKYGIECFGIVFINWIWCSYHSRQTYKIEGKR